MLPCLFQRLGADSCVRRTIGQREQVGQLSFRPFPELQLVLQLAPNSQTLSTSHGLMDLNFQDLLSLREG